MRTLHWAVCADGGGGEPSCRARAEASPQAVKRVETEEVGVPPRRIGPGSRREGEKASGSKDGLHVSLGKALRPFSIPKWEEIRRQEKDQRRWTTAGRKGDPGFIWKQGIAEIRGGGQERKAQEQESAM